MKKIYKNIIFDTIYIMFNIIKKLIMPKDTILLGRWNSNHCANIKNIFSNYDHCGDTICKDPREITRLINKEKLIKLRN